MSEPFLGMIQYFAFDWAPRGYATCSGQLLSIQQNAALFSLLGTYYGGNGVQTFALPDLRGRVAISQSQNGSYTMGQLSGTENTTMLYSNMPAHTHTAAVQVATSNVRATLPDPTGNFAAQPESGGSMYATNAAANAFLGAPSLTVGNAGSGIPFSILSPYLAINPCIATQGIFPSRN
ncbi:MAG: Tail Collar domain protein [Flavipsychrobacter sp.]|nr:Tail Collar domain protein [Flavipsychrobacter sp.]